MADKIPFVDDLTRRMLAPFDLIPVLWYAQKMIWLQTFGASHKLRFKDISTTPEIEKEVVEGLAKVNEAYGKVENIFKENGKELADSFDESRKSLDSKVKAFNEAHNELCFYIASTRYKWGTQDLNLDNLCGEKSDKSHYSGPGPLDATSIASII